MMKKSTLKQIFTVSFIAGCTLTAYPVLGDDKKEPLDENKKEPLFEKANQEDHRYVESNVISMADRNGFKWSSKRGDFVFNPFVLVQTQFKFEAVDDEGLNLSDPDNITDFGFGIPAALFGVAGKAFEKLSFNLTFNGACAGKACLLNQAWLEGNVSEAFRVRVGKFKTPMHWASLARIGQNLTPEKPTSLITRVNIPFDINASNPTMRTGFDLGIMIHGFLGGMFQYQVGVFNGEGIGVNKPTSTLSDDTSIPALLYSGRVALMPLGEMALREGGPADNTDARFLIAASGSYNVEANAESSNDLRAGLELAFSKGGLYLGAEGYLLHMKFMERLEDSPSYLFWGAYAQAGYLFKADVEPVVRLELFDRNSTDEDGMLIMPAVGLNYYVFGQNLKFQMLYQYLARAGHENTSAANDDDNSMAEHAFWLQAQFVL